MIYKNSRLMQCMAVSCKLLLKRNTLADIFYAEHYDLRKNKE